MPLDACMGDTSLLRSAPLLDKRVGWEPAGAKAPMPPSDPQRQLLLEAESGQAPPGCEGPHQPRTLHTTYPYQTSERSSPALAPEAKHRPAQTFSSHQ